jgi:hypothetical protein
MAALEKFEAAEGNLLKLERLWSEIEGLMPEDVSFGSNVEYEDRCRSYTALLAALTDGNRRSRRPISMDLPKAASTRWRWTSHPPTSPWNGGPRSRAESCGNPSESVGTLKPGARTQASNDARV